MELNKRCHKDILLILFVIGIAIAGTVIPAPSGYGEIQLAAADGDGGSANRLFLMAISSARSGIYRTIRQLHCTTQLA